MSEENESAQDNEFDDQDEDFVDFNENGEDDESFEKSSGGLKFLTFLMLLLAGGLFALPFVWGLASPKGDMTADPSVLTNDWLWWLGEIHVLVIHLPIGVFVWALTLEILGLLSFRKFKPHLGGTLFFASITAIIAAVLGYFNFLRGDYGPANLEWDLEGNRMGMHMWLTMLFTFFVILSFISKMWCRHNQRPSPCLLYTSPSPRDRG